MNVRFNGLAIAGFVCSIVGIFSYGVGSAVGVILSHFALRQIARDGTRGRGLAIAGLVVGYIWLGLVAIVIIAAFVGSR